MPSKGHLLRILGVGFGIAVTLGNTIGAGILRTPGTVAAQLGSVSLFMGAWILGAVYALVCAISVSELATMLPFEGGWYVYARRAFGGYGAFFAGYSDWLVQVGALAYLATAAGEFSSALMPAVFPRAGITAVASLVLFGLLQTAGIRLGSAAQKLASLAVGTGLLSFVIACFLLGPKPAVTPATELTMMRASPPYTIIGAVIALQSVIVTYDGWYGAIYFMEEDRNPARDLPRSAVGGILCSTAIFLLINMALLYVLPFSQLAGSKIPAADAAQIILGNSGQEAVLLISLLTVVATINAVLLSAPRVLFALARDGLFFPQAEDVNRVGTPVAGLLLTVLASSALCATHTFEKLIAIQSVLLVVLYLTGFTSFFVLRKREPDLPRPFKAWGYPWTPFAALLGSLVYLVLNLGSDPKHGMLALALVAASYPVYRIFMHLKTTVP